MLRRLAAFAAALGALPLAAADVAAPATLRLDYFHTGGRGAEIYAVDRVVREPLPWPGHAARTSDDGNNGVYRFEVPDASGRVLYARGFASILGEWATTAEAADGHRTFHESLRFPEPRGPVEVVVQRRQTDQGFATVWRTTLDPRDPHVDRAPPPRQELIAVERHGEPADKVDLLLVGDGYTAAECASKFAGDARRMAEALFRHEPFAARRGGFNVWGLCPPAEQSGVARPSAGIHRRTPVGAAYDAFGSERYVLTFDNRALRDVASWAPYEFLTILVNSGTYGGGGIFGAFATVAVDSDWEVVEPWEVNVTALLEGEPLKWRDLVDPATPVPTPWPKEAFEARQREFQAGRKQIRAEGRPEREMNALFREEQADATRLFRAAAHDGQVGAFRGADYDALAYYRPQLDCVMFTRNEVPCCRVCQRALEQVIDLYAGPRHTD